MRNNQTTGPKNTPPYLSTGVEIHMRSTFPANKTKNTHTHTHMLEKKKRNGSHTHTHTHSNKKQRDSAPPAPAPPRSPSTRNPKIRPRKLGRRLVGVGLEGDLQALQRTVGLHQVLTRTPSRPRCPKGRAVCYGKTKGKDSGGGETKGTTQVMVLFFCLLQGKPLNKNKNCSLEVNNSYFETCPGESVRDI